MQGIPLLQERQAPDRGRYVVIRVLRNPLNSAVASFEHRSRASTRITPTWRQNAQALSVIAALGPRVEHEAGCSNLAVMPTTVQSAARYPRQARV